MTAEEFNSDEKYAQALKSAIVSSIQSPPINESNVRDLTVADVVRRKLHSVHLQSGSSITASYTIVISTPFSSEAYSMQLNDAVNSGAFTVNLQLSDPGYASVTAPSLVLGKYATTYSV